MTTCIQDPQGVQIFNTDETCFDKCQDDNCAQACDNASACAAQNAPPICDKMGQCFDKCVPPDQGLPPQAQGG
jgi:hypothetical protein